MKNVMQNLKTFLRTQKGMCVLGLTVLVVVAVIVITLTAHPNPPDVVTPTVSPSVAPIESPEIDVTNPPDVTIEPDSTPDLNDKPVTTPTNTPAPTSKPTPTATPTAKPTHEHSYVVIDNVEATCTSPGYKTLKCSCGSSYQENTDAATGHNYKDEVIAPTTSAQGYTKHTCSLCGHTFKDNFTDPIVESTPVPTPAPTTEPTVPTPTVPPVVDPYCRTCGQYGHEAINCPNGLTYICSKCGKDQRTNHYMWAEDHVCESCGATVPAFSCHSH